VQFAAKQGNKIGLEMRDLSLRAKPLQHLNYHS
jgi:hypothetical protein